LCLNVLEYTDDPAAVVRSLFSVLNPGGSVIVVVPNSPGLFGSVDQTLGHKRRFGRAEMRQLLEAAGFSVASVSDMNRAGRPAWWFYGKILKRTRISKITLKMFDKTVWLWRRVDRLLPWSGLTLVVVATKPASVPLRPRQEQVQHANAIGR
jgi:SAM-dependent methyltransferase